ncbi:MAG TPA: thiamine-phosphate kinase [Verrucomicrobiota bacterium]|nr:thiamine-phosphate kinase [Verrucomicrobiales bacterium]HRI16467.1 thiamine-phosphate kinase [Verrucomicrobiota bacterium]
MTEFELVAALTERLPTNDFVVVGAGDDCAVLELGSPDTQTLFKTDAVVEGIHFTPETEPALIGHKALARCLSDIAAMGGTPTAGLVTIALPDHFESARITELYSGLNRLAVRHQVAVVGGETTSNPERLLISVTVLGTVPRGRAILRSGAKIGEAIFVTGELGGSRAGKHLDFEPRLAEGRWLAQTGFVTAMMDISDGLAGDLPHLLAASGGLGAEILATALPISRAARERARESDLAPSARVAALTDGEDFELLLTVAPGRSVALLDGWKSQFPSVNLTCIGKVTAGPGVWLRTEDGVRPLTLKGYQHFA